MVRDIAEGDASSDPQLLTPVGDLLYFSADDGRGRNLWRTDGTFDGTVFVPAFGSFTSNIQAITSFRDRAYFIANEFLCLVGEFGVSILLENSAFGQYGLGTELVGLGDQALLFSATARPNLGVEPFTIDVTGEGTKLLKDIRSLGGSSFPLGFYEWQGHLYFSARSVAGSDGVLWRTDGTEAGTELVSLTVVRDNPPMANTSDKLVVLAEGGLYFSDGTSAGTINVPLPAGLVFGFDSRQPGRFVGAGDNVYFYPRSADGFEVWTSDGTAEGARQLRDIAPGGANSNARDFTSFGGKMYFVADSPLDGTELWVTDGTTQGTISLTDFSTTAVNVPIAELFVDEGEVHFVVGGSALWRTDGTVQGTRKEADLGFIRAGVGTDDFFAVGSTLLFIQRDSTSGDLWKSDGTPAGTSILFPDIEDIANTKDVYAWNGATYFAARTDAAGMELWKTDGTADGTVPVRDIFLGARKEAGS